MLGKLSHKTYTYNNSLFYFCVLKHIAGTNALCGKGPLDPGHKGHILARAWQSWG